MTPPVPAAYAVHSGSNWIAAYRFANRLLRGGRRVLMITGTLSDARDDSTLAPGDLVVPLSPSFDAGLTAPLPAGEIEAIARDAGVELAPLEGTERFVAAPLAPVIAGLYGGGGAPFNQASILAECGFPVRFISDAEIRAGELSEIDVLVVPGGGFRAMHGQIEPLGEAGCRAIADFVARGGMYIGSCAGSYDCAIAPEDFVQSCPAQRHLQIINARVWNDASVDFGGLQSPGVGVVTIRNERPDHPVMFGLPHEFELAHYNGPIFDPLAEPAIEGASLATGLAAFSGWTEAFTPAEAFDGTLARADETLLSRAVAAGRYSAVAGYFGRGRVVAFGSHPEFGFDLPMVEWSNPARMIANAVMWQAMSGDGANAEWYRPAERDGRVSVPVGSGLRAVRPAADALIARVEHLRRQPIEPRPRWLTGEYAMSFFGLGPEEIWSRSLDDIEALARRVATSADDLAQRVSSLVSGRNNDGLDDPITNAVLQIEHWILDERPAEWRQDGGYQGVLALLRTATAMCDKALASWDIELGPPAGAYGYLHENPYHLVAGSYLAAVGCVAGAVQLLRALSAELDMAESLSRQFEPVVG